MIVTGLVILVLGAALENFPLENKKTFLVPRTQSKSGKRAAPNVAFSQLPPLPILSYFSWEEKLVAPLIATPNVDKEIKDK